MHPTRQTLSVPGMTDTTHTQPPQTVRTHRPVVLVGMDGFEGWGMVPTLIEVDTTTTTTEG